MEPTLRSNYESYAPSTPREREAARRFGTLAQLCFKPEPLRRGQICPDQAGQESSDVVLRALERSGLAYLDSAGIWQPTVLGLDTTLAILAEANVAEPPDVRDAVIGALCRGEAYPQLLALIRFKFGYLL
jgi:hypothetical protein